MDLTVAVLGAGEMGAAVGRRLKERGARVRTSLAGRSAASAARVHAAGLEAAASEAALLEGCDVVLSIVPPGQAAGVAERLAAPLAASAGKPVFVDCNAIAPATMRAIAATLAETGCAVVDAGIIGGPPTPEKSPVFYASGPDDPRLAVLRAHGLDLRRIEGGIGAASALKMAYGGITKGLIALGAMMLLGASRAGVAEAMRAELAASQPALAAFLARSVPAMYPKAYRWVAEMEEVAAFLGPDAPGAGVYRAIAVRYAELARAHAGDAAELRALDSALGRD